MAAAFRSSRAKPQDGVGRSLRAASPPRRHAGTGASGSSRCMGPQCRRFRRGRQGPIAPARMRAPYAVLPPDQRGEMVRDRRGDGRAGAPALLDAGRHRHGQGLPRVARRQGGRAVKGLRARPPARKPWRVSGDVLLSRAAVAAMSACSTSSAIYHLQGGRRLHHRPCSSASWRPYLSTLLRLRQVAAVPIRSDGPQSHIVSKAARPPWAGC